MIAGMVVMAVFCGLLAASGAVFRLICKVFPELEKWLAEKAETEMQWHD